MPNNTNSLKVKRPSNKIPRAHHRSSEEPRNGNSLRVIPILLPQPKQLTQECLPAMQRKPISKTSAPVRTQSKPTKPIQPKRNLKKEKEEAIEWLNNLRIYN